jgi:hypothetical protein
MTPYVQRYISADEMLLFETIKSAVVALPDLDLELDEDGKPIVMSCHMLARAVARGFRLKYADGYFYETYRHSWVETRSGNIIDVYPVAMLGGPILYEGGAGSPARALYRKTSAMAISDGKFRAQSFQRSVMRIRAALWRTNHNIVY